MFDEKTDCTQLGEFVAALMPADAGKTLLYAELDDGVVAPSLFFERAGKIYYVEPNDDIFDELFRLEEILGKSVKAIVLEDAGRSNSFFLKHLDEFNESFDKPSRTEAVLLEYFGNTKFEWT